MSTLRVNTIQEADGTAFPFPEVTLAQSWMLDSGFSGNANPIQGWSKYTAANTSALGSDMSESNGIWTFPSTGFYWIQTQGYHYGSGGNSSTTIYPEFSIDGGSNFSQSERSYTNVADSSGTWYNTSINAHFFDVTNTSTHKCKIRTDGNNQTINGGGTFVRFIRLGNT